MSETEQAATGGIVESLLKAPVAVAAAIADESRNAGAALKFLVTAAATHAIFGFAIGMFNGLSVAWMTALKAPLIAVSALIICLPSLYVFSAVAGAPLTMRRTVAIAAACLAMIGMLLIGLAPVAWLFAVSTASLAFIAFLGFAIWFACTLFGMRYAAKLRAHGAFERSAGVVFWFIVLMLVTLQMATCLRPILTPPAEGQGLWAGEKKFFLQHFGDCFEWDD